MTPTEFKTHLTNVTDSIITAYFHRIDMGFKILNINDQTYNAIICHQLMTKLVNVNSLIPEDHTDLKNELAQFGLKDPQALKQYCRTIFENHSIYQVDTPMTKMIYAYFNHSDLSLQNQLSESIAYLHNQQLNLYFIANRFYPSPHDFDVDLNRKLFGGKLSLLSGKLTEDGSFKRFLNSF